jgi:hypothetical protein
MQNTISKTASFAKYSILVFLLLFGSARGLQLQAQGTNAKGSGDASSSFPFTGIVAQVSTAQADTDESVAVFQIRSAFSLTPAMVQVLQKKMEEFAAQSSGKASSGTSSGASGTTNGTTNGEPNASNNASGGAGLGGTSSSTSQQGTSHQSTSMSAERGLEMIPWSAVLSRSVPMATPFDVRVVGDKIVAIMQIVPLDQDSKGVNLMIQTQIWAKQANGSVSYRTFIQPLSLPAGARIFYYPLGFSTKEGAPIVVEIKVDIVEKPKKLH